MSLRLPSAARRYYHCTMHSDTPGDDLRALIRGELHPLLPIPTDQKVRSGPVPGIRAVLFDVYGTLLISGSGDIGITADADEADEVPATEAVFAESGFGVKTGGLEDRVNQSLQKWIKTRHQELRAQGAQYPEVEIRDIWLKVLAELICEGVIEPDSREPDSREPGSREPGSGRPEDAVEELALRFELAVNPVWPMPGFPEIIGELSRSGCPVGIVSNAQFYTPAVIEEAAECSLESLGFSPELCAFSYRLARAKPSPVMFQGPLAALQASGIEPKQVLVVGNDMLNDMWAARNAGCRTCLFAGDKRSLRRRIGDERADFEPDMVITELAALRCFLSRG